MGIRSQLYLFGISVGVRTLFAGKLRTGLKAILNPLRSGYSRYVEFPYVLTELGSLEQKRVLDIGSPKMLALFCAARFKLKELISIDLRKNELTEYQEYQKACSNRLLTIETGDGRKLPYADESFDSIYSVSVIEHIDHDGDSRCVKEVSRLLKKGGRCVLSFPYAPQEEKVYHRSEVYEKEFTGKPNFFCRLYNNDAITERLLKPSGLSVVKQEYYVQKRFLSFRMDNPRQNNWMQVSPLLLTPFHLLSFLLCSLLLEQTEPEDITQEIPGTICMTLEKK